MNKSSVSPAKQRIINELQINSKRLISSSSESIFRRAAIEEYKMQDHFRNLQDPLQFLRNHQIEALINETENVSQNLQNHMNATTQFSKTIYKKVISNEDYVKFFKNQKDLNQAISGQTMQMQKVLKTQSYLRQLAQKQKDDSSVMKQLFIKNANKKTNDFLQKHKLPKQYRHSKTGDKQNLPQNINIDVKFSDIAKIDASSMQNSQKSNQMCKLLKIQQGIFDVGYNRMMNIAENEPIDLLMQNFKLTHIIQSSEYGEMSKQLFYDFEGNFKFWQQAQVNPFLYYSKQQLKPKKDEVKKKINQEVLRPFMDFRMKALNINNMCDVAVGKIKPQMISAYFDLKNQHYAKMQLQKRDYDLDQKYKKLQEQYMNFNQSKSKNTVRQIPIKLVETQIQTVPQNNQLKSHKFYDNYETVQDVLLKINKVNRIRERSMRAKHDKSKFIVLKNACLDINNLLFRLLLFMLTGQKFIDKFQQEIKQNKSIPYFTYTDLLKAENKQDVQKKLLQLVYTNVQNFQVQLVDDVPKKKIITTYVQQRQKNNKLLEIIKTSENKSK